MLRIPVDFNSEMSEPVGLVKLGSQENARLASLPEARQGDQVILFDEEMEVLATLKYQQGYWMALPDWTTRKICAA